MGKWTRRAVLSAGVIGGTGSLWVSLCDPVITRSGGHLVANDGEHLLHVFLKISDDNRVTAILPHSRWARVRKPR